MKPKKPDYEKWMNKESGISFWQMICLCCDIEPPKTKEEFIKLKSKNKKLREMEEQLLRQRMLYDMLINPLLEIGLLH